MNNKSVVLVVLSLSLLTSIVSTWRLVSLANADVRAATVETLKARSEAQQLSERHNELLNKYWVVVKESAKLKVKYGNTFLTTEELESLDDPLLIEPELRR